MKYGDLTTQEGADKYVEGLDREEEIRLFKAILRSLSEDQLILAANEAGFDLEPQ